MIVVNPVRANMDMMCPGLTRGLRRGYALKHAKAVISIKPAGFIRRVAKADLK